MYETRNLTDGKFFAALINIAKLPVAVIEMMRARFPHAHMPQPPSPCRHPPLHPSNWTHLSEPHRTFPLLNRGIACARAALATLAKLVRTCDYVTHTHMSLETGTFLYFVRSAMYTRTLTWKGKAYLNWIIFRLLPAQ